MTARHATRLLLLALLVAGVVGMHTTGHSQARHPAMAAAHADMDSHPATAMGMAAATPAPPTDTGMDPVEMCLAVLTVLGMLVLLAAAGYARQVTTRRVGGLSWRIHGTGRDPPEHPLHGLRITDLAVLRT